MSDMWSRIGKQLKDPLNYVSPIAWIPGVKGKVRDFGDRLSGSGKYDPMNKAMPYLNEAQERLEQIPDIIHQGYDPYIQQGQSAYNSMNPILSQMTSDPAGYLENIMKGYSASRGYNFKKDEALKAATATAAAGGRAGTPEDMMNQARITDILAGEDMQQWLQNVMGLQGQGLAGQQHFYDTGYGANQNLMSGLTGNIGDISNLIQSKGGLEFQGQSQRNKFLQELVQSLIKTVGETGKAAAMGGI